MFFTGAGQMLRSFFMLLMYDYSSINIIKYLREVVKYYHSNILR